MSNLHRIFVEHLECLSDMSNMCQINRVVVEYLSSLRRLCRIVVEDSSNVRRIYRLFVDCFLFEYVSTADYLSNMSNLCRKETIIQQKGAHDFKKILLRATNSVNDKRNRVTSTGMPMQMRSAILCKVTFVTFAEPLY